MKLKELHALMQIDSAYDEFSGRTVVDLGCGTAMLSIGAALLGSPYVLGLDIDPDALEVAQENVDAFEEPLPIDFALCDVTGLAGSCPRLAADTVIMNPPFGTKLKGADMDFLRAAFSISRHSVYSLHKSATRGHIQKVAERELGASRAEVLAELRYDLPATMKFHKQKSVDIEVDLWRFEVGQQQQ